MAVFFISIDPTLFLAPAHENADPLTAPGFYLHHVDMADQDPGSGNLEALSEC